MGFNPTILYYTVTKPAKRQPETATRNGNQKRQPEAAKSKKRGGRIF